MPFIEQQLEDSGGTITAATDYVCAMPESVGGLGTVFAAAITTIVGIGSIDLAARGRAFLVDVS